MNKDELIKKRLQLLINAEKAACIDYLKLNDIYCSITEVDNPYFNIVIDARADRHKSDNEIEACKKFFAQHNKPWLWEIFPGSDEHDLLQHGFAKLEQLQAMHFDLSKPIPHSDSTAIEISEAQDDLRAWLEPISEMFRYEKDAESYRIQNVRLLEQRKNFRFIMGTHNGTSVTAGTLFVDEDAAWLGPLATKAAYAKQGFGTALILYCMQIAKELRVKHLFLNSGSINAPFYQKLGFTVYSDAFLYDPAGFVKKVGDS
jgi:N-acetylglutamate synthase-like GNAT family acetyltransferase